MFSWIFEGHRAAIHVVLHYQRSYHQNQPNTMLHFTIMLFLLFCSKIITEGPINIENILQFKTDSDWGVWVVGWYQFGSGTKNRGFLVKIKGRCSWDRSEKGYNDRSLKTLFKIKFSLYWKHWYATRPPKCAGVLKNALEVGPYYVYFLGTYLVYSPYRVHVTNYYYDGVFILHTQNGIPGKIGVSQMHNEL